MPSVLSGPLNRGFNTISTIMKLTQCFLEIRTSVEKAAFIEASTYGILLPLPEFETQLQISFDVVTGWGLIEGVGCHVPKDCPGESPR